MSKTFPFYAFLSLLFVAGPSLAAGEDIQLSIGVERIGGISAATASPDESDDDVEVSILSLGGFVYNPAGAPRIGVDYVLPSGLTLGGALGATAGSASVDGEELGNGSFFLLEPRIGYRIPTSEIFDIIPRGGVTLLWGSFQEDEGETCYYDPNIDDFICTSTDGDEYSGSATLLSLEVVGVLRVTTSFNLLAGISYDMLMSASGELTEDNGDDRDTDRADYEGKASSIQLWFGLGGYL